MRNVGKLCQGRIGETFLRSLGIIVTSPEVPSRFHLSIQFSRCSTASTAFPMSPSRHLVLSTFQHPHTRCCSHCGKGVMSNTGTFPGRYKQRVPRPCQSHSHYHVKTRGYLTTWNRSGTPAFLFSFLTFALLLQFHPSAVSHYLPQHEGLYYLHPACSLPHCRCHRRYSSHQSQHLLNQGLSPCPPTMGASWPGARRAYYQSEYWLEAESI